MNNRESVIKNEKELVGLCKEASTAAHATSVRRAALILGLSAGTVGALAAACGGRREQGTRHLLPR